MATLLLVLAGLLVLVKAWHGWRLGVVRQVFGLAALALGWGCGYMGARTVGALLAPLVPLPERVLAALGGMALGLVVYLSITIVSAILFKKTGDQTVTLVRLLYGLGGALIGAVYGLALVAVFALGLRLLGSVAETKLALERAPLFRASRGATSDVLAQKLAAAKLALEAGPAGTMLRRVDPVPTSAYSVLTKLATLVASQRSMERLASYPGVKPVLEQPKVAALMNDPEMNRALAEHRYLALISNPRLIAAADDPEVARRLRAVDLEKALDYALREGSKQ
jgi:membrane protein required for colicin V production